MCCDYCISYRPHYLCANIREFFSSPYSRKILSSSAGASRFTIWLWSTKALFSSSRTDTTVFVTWGGFPPYVRRWALRHLVDFGFAAKLNLVGPLTEQTVVGGLSSQKVTYRRPLVGQGLRAAQPRSSWSVYRLSCHIGRTPPLERSAQT